MLFVGLFIALCVRNKFAIKYPDNPPSFLLTILFGLFYLLLYWSFIDESGKSYTTEQNEYKQVELEKSEKIVLAILIAVVVISLTEAIL